MCRRTCHAFEERHRQLRRRAKEGLETVLEAVEVLLTPDYSGEEILTYVYRRIGAPRLREAVDSCREFQRLEDRGSLDELCARSTNLRRYLPAVLSLPFAAETGSESLLDAISLVRRLDAGEISEFPKEGPCEFVPVAWRPALYRDDGTLDRRVWIIALSLAIRDALRAGDLYLAASRHHGPAFSLALRLSPQYRGGA